MQSSSTNRLGLKHKLFSTLIIAAMASIACRFLLGRYYIDITFVGVLILLRVWGVRTERFAPAIFTMRDPALPRNELELWAVSTYALWAESFSDLEGWPIVGGLRKNPTNTRVMLALLEKDWGIKTLQDGLKRVDTLLNQQDSSRADSAWDECRAVQLLGMFYVAGWMTRDGMDERTSRACRVLQSKYHSWDALFESYLKGCPQLKSEYLQESCSTEQQSFLYHYLNDHKVSPFSVPWDSDLYWDSGQPSDPSKVKRFLSSIAVTDGRFHPRTGRH